MGNKTAILAVKIIGDATSAVTSLEKVDGSAKSMTATMDKAAVGAGVTLAALVALGKGAGDAASELQQAEGAVDSVFGAYSDRVRAQAEDAAQSVGLAKDSYSNLSAVLGSQLKNMGVSMDELSGQSSDLIALGADLSATFGGTTADAVGAISSLLRGERDPIERYGVSLKQVDIDAKLAAMGLSDLEGEAAKSATTQATLALLLEQTSSASGQFARESDTAAGMQQRANAEWRNAQAALGEQLLPVMSEGARIMADLARWAGENQDAVSALVIVIAVLAGGILILNGAMKAYAAAQAVATFAVWASNAAWLANPITWIVLGIVAAVGLVIAIIVLWSQNWDQLTGDIGEGSAQIGGFFNEIGSWADDTFGPMIRWIEDAVGWFAELFGLMGKTSGWTGGRESSGIQARMSSITAEPMMLRTMAAPAALPSLPSIGALATPSSRVGNVTNNYVTVEGAIDKDGTARTISDLLTRQARTNGKIRVGQSWE